MEKDGEQPFEQLANASSEAIENGVEDVNGSQQSAQNELPKQDNFSEPCDLGKFKTPQALLDAYNCLQAEFTKKCQRLSEIEKEIVIPDQTQIDQACQEFLLQHAEAREFADQIKEKIVSCKSQPTMQAFDNAWASIVLEHVKQNASGDKIVDNLLSSESVRQTVIQNYLNSLKQSAPPITISSSGQGVAEPTSTTPQSLGEAKLLVEKMFS